MVLQNQRICKMLRLLLLLYFPLEMFYQYMVCYVMCKCIRFPGTQQFWLLFIFKYLLIFSMIYHVDFACVFHGLMSKLSNLYIPLCCYPVNCLLASFCTCFWNNTYTNIGIHSCISPFSQTQFFSLFS